MQGTMVIKWCLDKLFAESDTVFIVPHNRPDMDALGSSLGMASICKTNKKKCYIIINEKIDDIETATRDSIKGLDGKAPIINLSEAEELITDNSLLIVVDANRTYRISTEKILDRFKNIVVIDHHKIGDKTIKTKYLFVDENLSSACEVVSKLVFAYDAPISSREANYMLAGIILDTHKMCINTSDKTYEVAAELVRRGANPAEAHRIFKKDFASDRAIQKLIDNTIIMEGEYAVSWQSDDNNLIYELENVGKAANYLLGFDVIITFAIARIDKDTCYISARSKGDIDVSRIIRLFGGDGSFHSAAARIQGLDENEIKDRLLSVITPARRLIDTNSAQLTLKNNNRNDIL